jgi:hypothetical protein
MTLHDIAWHCMTHCMTLHDIAWHCIYWLHDTIYYCMTLHDIAWHAWWRIYCIYYCTLFRTYYCMTLHDVAWHCTTKNDIVMTLYDFCCLWCYIAWHCMTLHDIAWHCIDMTLHDTWHYCIWCQLQESADTLLIRMTLHLTHCMMIVFFYIVCMLHDIAWHCMTFICNTLHDIAWHCTLVMTLHAHIAWWLHQKLSHSRN